MISKPSKSSYLVTVTGEVDGSKDHASHYLAKGKMLGSFSLPHGRYLFYYLPAGSIEALKTRGFQQLKTDLANLAPELKGTLEDLQSWNDFPYMTPQDIRVGSWVADRVALIGDAAHSIEPSLGQGGSLTLSDVDVLLEVLESCFAKSDFSADALRAYEGARRPQTEVLQRMAELTAMMMNTSNAAVEWVRDRTLRKMRENQRSMMLALDIASGSKQTVSVDALHGALRQVFDEGVWLRLIEKFRKQRPVLVVEFKPDDPNLLSSVEKVKPYVDAVRLTALKNASDPNDPSKTAEQICFESAISIVEKTGVDVVASLICRDHPRDDAVILSNLRLHSVALRRSKRPTVHKPV
jgi:hypothetical protein